MKVEYFQYGASLLVSFVIVLAGTFFFEKDVAKAMSLSFVLVLPVWLYFVILFAALKKLHGRFLTE